MKQLLLSGAALASAVLFSSCTVDGYGYSGSYDTHYSSGYGGSYYEPSYYGAGYYGGGLIAPRYYSSSHHHYIPRGSSYCPPSRGQGNYSGHGSHGGYSGGSGGHGGRPHGSHSTVPRSSGGGGFSAYAEAARENRHSSPPVSRPVVERPSFSERPAPREMPSAPREAPSSGGGGRSSDFSGGGRPTFQQAIRAMKD